LLLFLLRLVDRLRDEAFPRARERDLVDFERPFAVDLRGLVEDFFLADEAFVFFRGRDFSTRTFFTVFLASEVAARSWDAARPASAPRTPPTTAPTGPATLPITAPVAAPAVCLEMGGISMFSEDPDEASPPFGCCSSSFGMNTELLTCVSPLCRSEKNPPLRVIFTESDKKSA
jgi:hypothetical protein